MREQNRAKSRQTIITKRVYKSLNELVLFPIYLHSVNYILLGIGGLSHNFAGSGQNRVTAKNQDRVEVQIVILLLPSLIDDTYFVICNADTELLKILTFHSVTIDTSVCHLTLSAQRRTAGIFIHALHVQVIF